MEREALALCAQRVKLSALKQVRRCRNYVLLHLRKQRQHHARAAFLNGQRQRWFTVDAGSWQECVEEEQSALPPRLAPANHHVPAGPLVFGGNHKGREGPTQIPLHFGEVAIATVALCIRWGSYFAVLANRDLPQWAAAFDPEVSCIGDGEMARINIEASAALSDWIDLMRADQPRFRKLVKAAVQLLPFPIAQLDGSTYYHRFRAFSAINSAHGRRYLMEAFARDFGSEWFERREGAHPRQPHARPGQWHPQRALAQRLGHRGRPRRQHRSPAATDAVAASRERRKRC